MVVVAGASEALASTVAAVCSTAATGDSPATGAGAVSVVLGAVDIFLCIVCLSVREQFLERIKNALGKGKRTEPPTAYIIDANSVAHCAVFSGCASRKDREFQEPESAESLGLAQVYPQPTD